MTQFPVFVLCQWMSTEWDQLLPSLCAMFLVPFPLYSLTLASSEPGDLRPWLLEADHDIAHLMRGLFGRAAEALQQDKKIFVT